MTKTFSIFEYHPKIACGQDLHLPMGSLSHFYLPFVQIFIPNLSYFVLT